MGKKRKSRKRADNSAASPAPAPNSGAMGAPHRLTHSLAAQLSPYQARNQEPGDKARKLPTGDSAPTAPRSPERRPSSRSPDRHRSSQGTATAPGSDTLNATDRVMLDRALSGVTPLEQKKRTRVSISRAPSRTASVDPAHDELSARARLGALVAGNVRFRLERTPDGEVRGWRQELKSDVVDRMYRRLWQPQARIDLHGQRSQEAAVSLARFVRAQKQRGRNRLLIVHGKGMHSEGGIGVLDDVAVQALTEGGAAPHVRAFATARRDLGGTGALMVQLEE